MVFGFVNNLNPLRWFRDRNSGRLDSVARGRQSADEGSFAANQLVNPRTQNAATLTGAAAQTTSVADAAAGIRSTSKLSLSSSSSSGFPIGPTVPREDYMDIIDDVDLEIAAMDASRPNSASSLNNSNSKNPSLCGSYGSSELQPLHSLHDTSAGRCSSKAKKRRKSASPSRSSICSMRAARKVPRMGVTTIRKSSFKKISPRSSPRRNGHGRRTSIITNASASELRRLRENSMCSSTSGCSSPSRHGFSHLGGGDSKATSNTGNTNVDPLMPLFQLDAGEPMEEDDASTLPSVPSTPSNSSHRPFFSHSPSPFSTASSTSGCYSASSFNTSFQHSPSPFSSPAPEFFAGSDGSNSNDSTDITEGPIATRLRNRERSTTPSSGNSSRANGGCRPLRFEAIAEEERADEAMLSTSESTMEVETSLAPETLATTSASETSAQFAVPDSPSSARRSQRSRRPVVPFGAVVNFMASAHKKSLPLRRLIGTKSVKRAQSVDHQAAQAPEPSGTN